MPLFDCLLVFENFPVEPEGDLPLEIDEVRLFEQSNYPVTLVVMPGEQLTLRLDVDTGRFPYGREFLGNFRAVLNQLAAGANPRLGDIDVLTDEERQRLVNGLNQTRASYPAEKSLEAGFADQVRRGPHRMALAYGSRQWTYDYLNRRANGLARKLRLQGVGPGTVVAVLSQGSETMMVAILATLKAGGAYLPLDPTYPEARLNTMLNDALPKVFITHGTQVPNLAAGMTRLSLNDIPDEGGEAELDLCNLGGDRTAMIFYTSGSTGRPKGVCVTHRAVFRLLCNTPYFQLRHDERMAQAANLSFDAATWEIWGGLLHGGILVGLPKETMIDPTSLATALSRFRVNHLFLTPALFNEVARREPGAFGELTTLITGGEAPTRRWVNAVLEAAPPKHMINGYGPTECTTFTTWFEMAGLANEDGPVPLGRPIANTTLYLVDRRLRPVPFGAVGQLVVGGPGLASGYLNRPGLTAGAFVPDPFSLQPGGRLYLTGDLARYRPALAGADPLLDFLGRADHQVKIRGFRIEPGDVAAALADFPGVGDGLVQIWEPTPGDKRLLAYVTPEPGTPNPPGDKVREFLESRLPAYMVPHVVLPLKTIPLTANGKVDRTRLPLPEPVTDRIEARAPRNQTEALLTGIFEQVLHRDRVGVDDNFFELGGHSLLAAQITGRIRDCFGIQVPMVALFRNPTPAALAAVVAERKAEPVSLPAIDAGSAPEHPPLSFAQQRLYFLDHLEGANPAYHVPFYLKLLGELNAAALEWSLGNLVSRHEPLRTHFRERRGRPEQWVQQSGVLAVPLLDLSALPSEEACHQADLLARELAQEPFDLSSGPVFRVRLIRVASTEHHLLITVHHIAFDGWSLDLTLTELTAGYRARVAGQDPELAQPPICYGDYAHWQHQVLRGKILNRRIRWWTKQLAGFPALLEVPSDRPRPALRGHRGGSVPFHLETATFERLRRLFRGEKATLFMGLQAAFALLLHRYGCGHSVPVGTPVANRDRAETQGLVGFFVNTVVLCNDLSADPPFTQLLARTRQMTLNAMAHQDVPFEKVVDAMGLPRDLNSTPLFQVMFALQNAPLEPVSLPGLRLEPMNPGVTWAKFDLVLNLWETETSLGGTLDYHTDLFEADTVRRMLDHYRHLLRAIVTSPRLPVSRLPMLGEGEKRSLMVALNQTTQPFADGTSLAEAFSRMSLAVPHRVAVATAGESLSFSALEARARSLAFRLRDYGVGPDVPVGLYVERTPGTLVGLLAILLAGGAYVPLDPNHPSARLQAILDDAKPPLVLAGETDIFKTSGLPVWCPVAESKKPHRVVPLPSADPGNLAYIIYTSGSLGRPRPVGICQRSVMNLLQALKTPVYAGHGDRGLRVSLNGSLAFDTSVKQIFQWLEGHTLVLIPEPVRFDGSALLKTLQTQAVDVFDCTPAQLQFLLAAGMKGRPMDVLLGGDALDGETWNQLIDLQGFRFYNVYGPTECTVDATLARVQGRQPVIGGPVANVNAYVLDPNLELVPTGVPGELFIGGAGLARGYPGRARATALGFLPNPFGGSGSRLYRTGDRVRLVTEGSLSFLGRQDHQIKIRGYRVEPGEIESALRSLAPVEDAAVVVHRNQDGHPRLMGYVRLGAGSHKQQTSLSKDLRAALGKRLPPFMVPAAIGVLDAFPLTANGKLDRNALAELESPALEAAPENQVAPRCETERQLAAVFCKVLGLKQVGIHDNFFELGGDSIISLQIVAHAAQKGLALKTRDLFDHQTIAVLAEVARRTDVPKSVQGQSLPLGNLPLTPIQERFFQRRLPNPNHFNQAALFRPSSDARPHHWKRALAAVIRHHDALRLRFRETRGSAKQRYGAANSPTPFRVVDLRGLEKRHFARQLRGEIQAAHRALNLEKGPLIRMLFFRADSPDLHRLFMVIHHLAVDGVSWRILLEDLCLAYGQICRPEAVNLPAKTASFGAWAQKMKRYAQNPAVLKEASHWLSLPQPDPLPRDKKGGGNGAIGSASTVEFTLSKRHTKALLMEVPKAFRTRMDDVLLAALLMSFAKWTGSNSLLVELEGHGREPLFEDLDLSRTLGWFTCAFPVFLEMPSENQLGTLLKAVKEQVRAVPNRGIGYGVLQYLKRGSEKARQLKRRALPQVVFNYLGQLDNTLAEGALGPAPESPGQMHDPKGDRSHLIDINAFVSGGKLKLYLGYSKRVHHRKTAQNLARLIKTSLIELIQYGTQPGVGGVTPSDFPLAAIDQGSLDTLAAHGAPEDLYPLSPMQEGMLFHCLYQPERQAYFEQITCVLDELNDVNGFQKAWQKTVDRHPVLRTAFHWQGLTRPLQAVFPKVVMPFTTDDWRRLGFEERERKLTQYLEGDRQRGFHLERAPLMRCALFRLGRNRYQFVWSHHHLLLDGWSLPLLFDEIFARYRGARDHDLQSVPPFRNYISWLENRDRPKAEAWWRERLKGLTGPTPLPLERRGGGQGRYARHGKKLAARPTQALGELARCHRLTLNTLVQGAWSLVLARYADTPEVVFGATVSGRPAALPGVSAMIGNFINSLPVRVAVHRSERLLPWLSQIQQGQLQNEAFSYTPLATIQGLAPVSPGTGLFDSILVFRNTPVGAASEPVGGNPKVSRIRGFEQTNYALTLLVQPASEMELELVFEEGRFRRDQVDQILGHLLNLLQAVAETPHQTLAELPMLRSGERQRMLVTWNDTGSGETHHPLLHHRFQRQAAQRPHRVAVIHEGQCLSYAYLNDAARNLALVLQNQGVGPDTLVALCCRRGPAMICAMVAIHLAGGAYVPLDPAYPKARLELTLTNSGAEILLTERALRTELPQTHAQVIFLEDGEGMGGGPARRTGGSVVPTAENLSHVITTSGSTGRPKCVGIPHRATAALGHWMTDHCEPAHMAGVLASTSICFDLSVFEILGTLALGGAVVLAENALQCSEIPDRHRITLVNTVPTAMTELLQLGGLPPSVCVVNLAGEPLRGSLVRDLYQKTRVSAVYNLYGPSEDTTYSTVAAISPDGTSEPAIGKPLSHTRAYLVNRHLEPVPPGARGQLVLGGLGLARGYLGRPDLTASRFVPDPFSQNAGGRLYQTGDLAAYDGQGDLHFAGRSDFQVKLRGFRIELGEIETRLAEHPVVDEAAVVLFRDSTAEPRLVAYVQTSGTNAAENLEPKLRRWLAQTLPRYMVPSQFVHLDRLPLNPNGKLDRKALPAPDAQPQAGEGTLPRNVTETKVAEVWSEVLGRQGIGIHQQFFDLGGHSLSATRIVARLRGVFQIPLTLRNLFENPTVAQLSNLLLEPSKQPDLPPVTRSDPEEPLRLSFSQKRLWFLAQLETQSRAYHMPAAMRLDGALDVSALERAFGEILQRHQVLRSRYPKRDGQPMVVVDPTWEHHLPLVDLTHLPASHREPILTELLVREVARPFDLGSGPLVRLGLWALASNRHLLLVHLHHLVSDAWSGKVLVDELSLLYHAFVAQNPSPLPQLQIQYSDVASWQNRWLRGPAFEHRLAWWVSRLQDLPPQLELPTDHAPPAVRSDRGGHFDFVLDPSQTRALADLGKGARTTLFMTLQALFGVWIARLSGAHDFAVGTPVANRRGREQEHLIGCFINTLALRFRLEGNPGFLSFLEQVKQTALDAFAREDVPFEQVVDALQLERNLGSTPLFQVMFHLQNAPRGDLDFPGLTLTPMELDRHVTKMDLGLSVYEASDGLHCRITYAADLFEAASIQPMAGYFRNLVEGVMADPEQRVFGIPLLDERQRQIQLTQWNQPSKEPQFQKCLHQLIEAEAARTPHRIALVEERGKQTTALTYGTLNRHANQMAHRLEKLGAGPETLVAIAAERRASVLVAMLAVLKSGAAYLPLDPQIPAKRLNQVLADAAPLAFLADGDSGFAEREPGVPVIALEKEWCDRVPAKTRNPNPRVNAANPAYVIYTSGSTGHPKGVVIPHGAIVNYTCGIVARLEPQSGWCFALVSTLAADLGLTVVYGSLCSGGTLVLPSQDTVTQPRAFASAMTRFRVDVLKIVPSHLAALQQGERPGAVLPRHRLVLGGDAFKPGWVAQLQTLAPQCTVMNHYGPTEATVGILTHPCEAGDQNEIVPLGRPLSNARALVLDRYMELAPPGVAGELYLGGAGLARGYLGRPATTAMYFVPDPFACVDQPGSRLYRSGDKARWQKDGMVVFLGRMDDQVKIRGFRVEPGEVQAMLTTHPQVEAAFVTAKPVDARNLELVAYVETAAEPEGLRTWLKARLPDAMIPSHWVVLPELPLTSNGKVDRRALPEPTGPTQAAPSVAARNPLEFRLLNLWRDILEKPDMGVHGNFFELGGHSLLAVRLMGAIGTEFGWEPPLALLFQAPTVAALARYLNSKSEASSGRKDGHPGRRVFGTTVGPTVASGEKRVKLLKQSRCFKRKVAVHEEKGPRGPRTYKVIADPIGIRQENENLVPIRLKWKSEEGSGRKGGQPGWRVFGTTVGPTVASGQKRVKLLKLSRCFKRKVAVHEGKGPRSPRTYKVIADPFGSRQENENLVPIRAKGNRPPFFCVHPAGGNVLCYADLAQAMGPDQPFYGLQASEADGFQTVEERATEYVSAMRSVQPKGPYHLGGWSSGGLVAYEMAVQLKAQGEAVAYLALLDSFPRDPDNLPDRGDEVKMLADFAAEIARAAGQEPPVRETELHNLKQGDPVAYVLGSLKQANLIPAEQSETQWHRMWTTYRDGLLAGDRYRPKPFGGRLHLYLAAEDDPARTNLRNRWKPLVGEGLVIHRGTSPHHQMVTSSHAAKLAVKMLGDMKGS